jgi:predicted TIM-barrel enzyme/transcriptional regulator with AAA-type ATPase domain
MQRFVLKPAHPGEILVGAAIGLGMTARAAVQGGADFLLALNAGRLRVMGAASNAAMLPIRESNGFTDGFARHEILRRVSAPVFFGACAMDPTLSIDALVRRIGSAGYHGVANFPTAIHLDGQMRSAVEQAGIGFAREVELLAAARASGLATLGYAKTKPDVERLAEAGVDMICLNFGWNAGGSMGIGGAMNLAAATDHAKRLFALVRRMRPDCLCFVEGGPIVLPKDAVAVCDGSGADGYIGGSTLDRLPLEMSVMQTTSAFKAASLMRDEQGHAAREQSRISGVAGLIGQSEAMGALVDQLARLARTELSVCIAGEPGSGKTTVARALHVASRSQGPFLVLDAGDPDIEAKLFGRAGPGLLQSPDGHLVIENIEKLAPSALAGLRQWVERVVFERFQPQAQRPPHARVIVTTSVRDPGANALVARLAPHIVEVPPLRARLEDVPALARAILATHRRRGSEGAASAISADGMRELLRHGWPGNVRELAAVLARATAMAPAGGIDGATILRLLGEAQSDRPASRLRDERGWILEALTLHRFRRAETAKALGLSRKTLYNKMRRYGMTG